jgi:SNF2-related domain
MKSLRPYQIEIASKACEILQKKKIVYLAMEVRTGKTSTSFEVVKQFGATDVLFITKKKAISSIEADHREFGYKFDITIINSESLHLIGGDFDLVISDEHHRNGAFPKMNKVTQLIKERYSKLPMIFLSGTPTPESYSQIYHQFAVSVYSPFINYSNFYKWAKDFVNVKERNLGYAKVNDYSEAYQHLIKQFTDPYMISFTQEQAGFTSSVNETILYCPMEEITHKIINKLKQDKIVEGKEEVILADTGVKLMGKIHQLCSGTVKFESGNSKIIDYSKAYFIQNHFKGQKIAIFYKFTAEYEMLKEVFQEHLTNDLDIFNTTSKNIALQIVSGREGISLKMAKYLVYLNIDFSAVSYWQSRDRLTTMERLTNNVYWIFSIGGIESRIYQAVQNKKDYTLSQFINDDRATNTNKNYQET